MYFLMAWYTDILLCEKEIEGSIEDENRPKDDSDYVKHFFWSAFFELPEVIRSWCDRKTIPLCLNEDNENKEDTHDNLYDEKYFKHMIMG